jgi:endonuclease YncB( thermonuclease family)
LIEDISTLQCGVGDQVTTASGAVETVRECGIVYMHEDGDTTHVKTTANKMVEVRNIGLQTPERKKGSNPAQCGAEEAYQHFKALMPEEITIVQLRSISNSTNGWGGGSRPLRSVYKLNNATGAFDIDVQAEQIKAGWSLWWPHSGEWAHNKAYLDLANDAKNRGVGIWNPNHCGAATGSVPLMWVNSNAPTIDTNTEPAFGEYVILKNNTAATMDLTNWMLRDNSLNFFWNSDNGDWMQRQNKFGSMVIPAGEHRIIYLDNPARYELSATEYEYFNWSRNTPGAQLTNPYISGNYINGDGIYLQDPRGNIRASMTNPCTSSAACPTPDWVTEIISSTRAGQIIPIPVALNKVKNSTRDIYNPVLSIASNANTGAVRTALTAQGFLVNATVGDPIDSPRIAGTPVGISTSTNGANLVGSRLGIANLAGTAQTTVWIREASGYNAIPAIVGMPTQQAIDTLTAAGFGTVATTPGASVGGVTGTVASLTVDGAAPGARHLLNSTIVLTLHP